MISTYKRFTSKIVASLLSAAVVATVVFLASSSAKAQLLFQFTENAGSVDVELSGSINLDALGAEVGAITNNFTFVNPTAGLFSVGSGATTGFATGLSDFPSFGSGGEVLTIGNASGDRVALFSDQTIALPEGYVSGTPLSGTSSFDGTFETLGLTPGSSVIVFDSGVATDTLGVNIGPVAVVPEPSSLAIVSLIAGGFLTRRRRSQLG